MDLTPSDKVLAVMGVTGCGKSTFIKTITGREDIQVGHTLTSETVEVQSYRFRHQGVSYVLVDTPGFNDTTRSDKDVLQEIERWLESSYRNGIKLTAIIYLHRILDVRMQGSALCNLRMFRKLCGEDSMRNVVLATTFWEVVDARVGQERERQLIETPELWGDMVERDSRVCRVGLDRESGLQLLESLARIDTVTLKVQDELVNQNVAMANTGAARAIGPELAAQEERFRVEMQAAQFRKEMQALETFKEAVAREANLVGRARLRVRFTWASLNYCNRCLKQVLPGISYQCYSCPGGPFDLCYDCYSSGKGCYNPQDHTLRLVTLRPSREARSCARLRNHPGSLHCDRCGESPGNLYFHCCSCNYDDYDLCVRCCVLYDATCLNRSHVLTLYTRPSPRLFPEVY